MSSNHAPLPLDPEQLDELLSAALDGEFESAARELGMSVDDADARLRSTPGADERRTALAAARDLLGATPPLDDLLAARLRAKAVRVASAEHEAHAEERRRRRSRILLSAGGIAAAIAAIVAVANGVHGFGSEGSSAKSSSAPAATAPRRLTAPTGSGAAPTALGSFADARALAAAAVQRDTAARARAQDQLKSGLRPVYGNDSQTATTAGNFSDSAPSVAATTPNGATASSGKENAPAHGSAATCPAPPQVPNVVKPVLRATATLSGKPVVVLVYANATEHVVVIEDTNCRLLNLQMLP